MSEVKGVNWVSRHEAPGMILKSIYPYQLCRTENVTQKVGAAFPVYTFYSHGMIITLESQTL